MKEALSSHPPTWIRGMEPWALRAAADAAGPAPTTVAPSTTSPASSRARVHTCCGSRPSSTVCSHVSSPDLGALTPEPEAAGSTSSRMPPSPPPTPPAAPLDAEAWHTPSAEAGSERASV
eukprot:450879-Pelagomonas_calceolata.AAC.3